MLTHIYPAQPPPGIAYYHDKSTVILEARVFNESPISPRKCRALLTRIVFLLYVGETFTTQEATTLFFGVTKLFQHKDVSWQWTRQ
jgi:coatomer protein complex subunit gamma